MSDIEARFRNGLHQAVANQPRLGPIDVDEVIAQIGRASCRERV